ncbi:hypothetical protein LINGRAHAP2_LOCUS29293, partial [Linum grandiflorum]
EIQKTSIFDSQVISACPSKVYNVNRRQTTDGGDDRWRTAATTGGDGGRWRRQMTDGGNDRRRMATADG